MSSQTRHVANCVFKGMAALQARRPKARKRELIPIPINRWNIVRGDKVEVNSGPDKGKQGTVLEVIREKNKIVVDGVRMRKTTTGPTPRPIWVSSVNLICPQTNQPTKVSRRFTEEGTKVRVARLSGAIIPKPEWVRHRTRRTLVGPKDTAPEDVYDVTYEGYVAPLPKAKRREERRQAAAAGGAGEAEST